MPPVLITDALNSSALQEDAPGLGGKIIFRWRCHRLFLDAFTAIARAIPAGGSREQGNVLAPTVSLFESQMADLIRHAENDIGWSDTVFGILLIAY
jgi:hypothetical protein